MNNQRFDYLATDSINGYFTIHDSTQIEFNNGKIYAQSKIVWTSCKDYYLVIKVANYDKGLGVGDTLYISQISLRKDTLTYLASAYGQSYRHRVIKAK